MVASLPKGYVWDREAAGRKALEVCGWDVSPEFATCLFPRAREKWVGGGWQAGKSVEGHAEIVISIVDKFPRLDFRSAERNLYRAWVIVPTYTAPKLEMDYLLRSLSELGFVTGHHFQDGSSSHIELWDGRGIIETRTAQDPEAIAGEPCDDVLVVEAGQMPEIIRTQCQGRIITRRGNITYTGTLEDDEAKPRYVWYGKAIQKYQDAPTADCAAFALPSWANRTVFSGGRYDPEIVRQEQILGPHAFSRRIAGIPSGSQYPVYPQLATVPQMFGDYGVPPGHDRWVYSMGAGGHDFGEGQNEISPSTLGAGMVNDLNELWIREIRVNWSSNQDWIERGKRELSGKYRIPWHRWGYDPMQTEAALKAGAQVAGRAGSRLTKVGLVSARAEARKIRFDLEGQGVQEGLSQMGRVHYVKKHSPEKGEFFEYHRSDDDLAATVENIVWVVDAGPRIDLPRAAVLVQTQPPRRKPEQIRRVR